MLTYLKYLGRVTSAAENDCPALVKNLFRARKVWRRMSCILSGDGAVTRVSGLFFKAMLQAVMLFGVET